jgi:hypothetical protein
MWVVVSSQGVDELRRGDSLSAVRARPTLLSPNFEQ